MSLVGSEMCISDRPMDELGTAVHRRTKAATTFGWVPRCLHSTGQLHKGGPGSGVFVPFLGPGSPDLPIPGPNHTCPLYPSDAADE